MNPPRIENLLAGGGQEGVESGGAEGELERVEEGGCLPSGYIASPSAFDSDVPPSFFFFSFLFTFLRCDRSHGRIHVR